MAKKMKPVGSVSGMMGIDMKKMGKAMAPKMGKGYQGKDSVGMNCHPISKKSILD